MKKRLTVSELHNGIREQNRVVLGQAITLIESQHIEDEAQASQLIERLLPYTGKSVRIGITGVPGVGKSTFIESFGSFVTQQNKKLAVLTVDPTSQITKGSILGDKTRMESLSKNPNAFIRPSASGSVLGGVAGKTREAMLLCEAAGFDVIIVETVGTGQSETSVKNMTDFFLLLMLAGAGDELQGIKKGIMEMADAVVITKADGDNKKRATQAAADYQHALHLFQPSESNWSPSVLTCSALEKEGIDKIWEIIMKYQLHTETSGYWMKNREAQAFQWMLDNFDAMIHSSIQQSTPLQNLMEELKTQLSKNEISALIASRKLFDAFKNKA